MTELNGLRNLPADLLDFLVAGAPLGPWIKDAGCADLWEAFTADRMDPADRAVLARVCRECPVRPDCAAYADDTAALGMWGGVYRSPAFYRRQKAA